MVEFFSNRVSGFIELCNWSFKYPRLLTDKEFYQEAQPRLENELIKHYQLILSSTKSTCFI